MVGSHAKVISCFGRNDTGLNGCKHFGRFQIPNNKAV